MKLRKVGVRYSDNNQIRSCVNKNKRFIWLAKILKKF